MVRYHYVHVLLSQKDAQTGGSLKRSLGMARCLGNLNFIIRYSLFDIGYSLFRRVAASNAAWGWLIAYAACTKNVLKRLELHNSGLVQETKCASVIASAARQSHCQFEI